MFKKNELKDIVQGALLVILIHILVIAIIFFLGYALLISGLVYKVLSVWIYIAMGFSLIQLVYVIPLALRLKRQGRWGMMKGVIVGAVLTALLNGAGWLWFSVAL
jgi:Na+/proline symporter